MKKENDSTLLEDYLDIHDIGSGKTGTQNVF